VVRKYNIGLLWVRVRPVTAHKGGVIARTVYKGRVRPVTVRKYTRKVRRVCKREVTAGTVYK
jgi:hypothetical protein